MTLKEQMLKADRHTYRSDILYRYGLEIAMLYSILEWGTYQGDTKRLFTAKEIAEAIGKSEKWVRRYLRKMEQLGLIEIEGVHSKGYHITLLLVDKLTRISGQFDQNEEPKVDKMTTISGQFDQKYVDNLSTLVDKLTRISGQFDQKHPQQMQSETDLEEPLKNIENIKENIYIEDREAKSTSANASAPSLSGGDTQKPFEKEKASPSVKEKKDPHPPTSAAPPSPTGEAVLQPLVPKPDEVKEVVKHYNEISLSLPKVKKITDSRRRRIKKLLREYGFDTIVEVFRKAEASDFLSGRNGRWQGCNFDWLIKESNFVKVLEGAYDNRHGRQAAQPHWTQEEPQEKPKRYKNYRELYTDDSEEAKKLRRQLEQVLADMMNAGADGDVALNFAEAIVLNNGKYNRQQALAIYNLIKQGLTYAEARKKVS